jgi:hypothetical protein
LLYQVLCNPKRKQTWEEMAMRTQQINRVSSTVLLALSLTALLAVLSGYFQAPHTDEGSSAHVFQVAVVAVIPVIALFLATADWKQRWRSALPLVFPAIALAVAFAALFYLEHYFYLHH